MRELHELAPRSKCRDPVHAMQGVEADTVALRLEQAFHSCSLKGPPVGTDVGEREVGRWGREPIATVYLELLWPLF